MFRNKYYIRLKNIKNKTKIKLKRRLGITGIVIYKKNRNNNKIKLTYKKNYWPRIRVRGKNDQSFKNANSYYGNSKSKRINLSLF